MKAIIDKLNQTLKTIFLVKRLLLIQFFSDLFIFCYEMLIIQAYIRNVLFFYKDKIYIKI